MIDEIRLLAIRSAQDDSVPVADRVQHFRAVFNSAEMYLQTWEKTIAARDAILANDNGGEPKEPVTPVLRQAWGPNNPPPWTQ